MVPHIKHSVMAQKTVVPVQIERVQCKAASEAKRGCKLASCTMLAKEGISRSSQDLLEPGEPSVKLTFILLAGSNRRQLCGMRSYVTRILSS